MSICRDTSEAETNTLGAYSKLWVSAEILVTPGVDTNTLGAYPNLWVSAEILVTPGAEKSNGSSSKPTSAANTIRKPKK